MKSSRRKKPRGQLQRHQRHGVFHGHRPYSRRGLYAFICLAKCGRNNTGKVPAAGIKLPKQTVQIFNVAFLPGAIRVGKVDLAMQPFFHTAPVGKPRTPVAGNGLAECRSCPGVSPRRCLAHIVAKSYPHSDGHSVLKSASASFGYFSATVLKTKKPITQSITNRREHRSCFKGCSM